MIERNHRNQKRRLTKLDEIDSLAKHQTKSLKPLRISSIDQLDDITVKKKTPEKMFRSLKYEISNIHKPILYDNFWSGIFAIMSSKREESRFYPMTEFFFKYSEALQLSCCINIDKEYLSMKKLGFGIKLIVLAFGYGDGFFRSFLDNPTLKKTWEVFQVNSLVIKDYQFMPSAFCIGFNLSFFKNFFLSLFYRNDGISSLGFCFLIRYDYFFFALYGSLINSYCKMNFSFFNEALFAYFAYEKEYIGMIGINIIQIIFAMMYLKNLSDFVNQYFSFFLMGEMNNFDKTKLNTENKQFIAAICIKIGPVHFIIFYQNGEFKIMLTLKFSYSMSILGYLDEKDKDLEQKKLSF